MWTFSEVVRIEQNFGAWYALVTLEKLGVAESQYLRFEQEPTLDAAAAAGGKVALQRNLAEAVVVSSMVTKHQFRMKFSLTERITLDNVADNTTLTEQNRLIAMTILKDFSNKEDGIDMADPITQQGVGFFESIGLIAPGRSAQVIGG